jgi:uncharacterized protein YjbI with pentapeptide repeats
MANPEHLAILKQGVEGWNSWRTQHPEVYTDLRVAVLSGFDLTGADFRETSLRGAHLCEANLHDADLRGADLAACSLKSAVLTGADLTRADVSGCLLDGADLRRANLRGSDLREASLLGSFLAEANLSGGSIVRTGEISARQQNISESGRPASTRGEFLGGTNLRGAKLRDADLAGAWVGATSFTDLDLRDVVGLEGLRHLGPSSIGIDTIYKSDGKIPEMFLRGCGLQDWEIELAKLYHPDLGAADLTTILYRVSELRLGNSIRYSSCFISYSTKDQQFADRLYADLQSKRVQCWFAPHDIKGGRKIHEQLDEAIRLHDKLLLILSESSMNSNWVQTEIAKARKRESEETKRAAAEAEAQTPGSSRNLKPKRMLFPVTLVPFDPAIKDWECFDADTGKDSAREIREYFIPDFSNWKDHDAYQKAFQKLVADLKAETSKL